MSRHKGCVTLGLALLAAIAAPADAGRIVGVDMTHERIVVRFDEAVGKATAFVLADPDRIAVDVEGADKGGKVEAAGPVVRVRQSTFARDTTRVVFDMAEPTTFTGGRLAPDGRALTLNLATVAPENMAMLATTARRVWTVDPTRLSTPPRARYSLTVPLRGRSRLPKARIAGPAGRPLVVIDAGHGGHDPGAIGPGGEREKDVTLALARAIRDELLAGGRVRVAMTRDDDRFLVLGERSRAARALGADLFISVHADAAGPEASGATIYTLSEVASDRQAARLAARENRADIINGVNLGAESSDVSSILIDLAQRETMNASSRFADLVHREASPALPFKRDYHRMAGFAVLKAPDTPAILFEAGYITSPRDVARLLSPEGRRAVAVTLRRATDVHFARRMAAR